MTADRLPGLSEHRDELIAYVARLSGDPELARDAAQEAFARFADRPPADHQNLRAWLYTVATNHALDVMKTARRRADLLTRHGSSVPTAPHPPTPEEILESRERRDLVRGALDQLRPSERQVLVLRAEGYSYREISGRTGIPVNSIGVTASRALRKLATLLEPLQVSP